MQKTPRVLCVLGMHRSGTSCLTGSLQEAGVELGNCHTWNPHNVKGNRENQAIVDLNDEVLGANGAAWDRPRDEVHWSDVQHERARVLVAENSAQRCFAFKDPRTLLTLDGWLKVIPDLSFIGIFRHPVDVAKSLHNRSGMPIEQGMALWYAYNRRLWSCYRAHKFPVLCFDDEAVVFQSKLDQVLKRYGLPANGAERHFYDSTLRTARGDGSRPLGWRIAGLLRKLKNIAE